MWQGLHGEVREAAVAQLMDDPERYRGFAVGTSFDEYVGRMMQPNTWGDNLSLQAIADAYNVEVCCLTTYGANSIIRLKPATGKAAQQIWLGFYAEFHYNSLVSAL